MNATMGAVWDVLQRWMPGAGPMTLQQIYELVESHLSLDAEDQGSDGFTQTVWKRNVRNVLQHHKVRGDIGWLGDGRYLMGALAVPAVDPEPASAHPVGDPSSGGDDGRGNAMATTQQLMTEACGLIGVAPISQLVGSTEPAEFYHAIADALGVDRTDPTTGRRRSKGRLTEAIITAAGLPWDDDWDGRNTPSRGGGSVSNDGLEQLIEAIKVLQGGGTPTTSATLGAGLGTVPPMLTIGTIARRQQQSRFKAALMAAYDGACAVTGTSWAPVLEGAHIEPYATAWDNRLENGILLRSDIHALFDKRWLLIEPATMVVRFHRSLRAIPPEYAPYVGNVVRAPVRGLPGPDVAKLQAIWDVWA